MTPEQFQAYLNLQKLQIQSQQRIADLLERAIHALDQLLAAEHRKSPRYMATTAEYPTFNWGAIGAEILRCDKDGLPDLLKHKGQIYARRAKPDQDNSVWFSRSLGGGEYEVLVKFLEPPKSKRLNF